MPCWWTTPTADELIPLAHLGDGMGRVDTAVLAPPRGKLGVFTVRDSLLSEYAAVGFEYGYSVEAPEALVAWEAQFGDFANGAQIIIDNFLAAAEIKWGQYAGLVMLLPARLRGAGARAFVLPHSSGSSRSAPGGTCGSPSPRPRPSTSTCCARRPC